MTARTRDQLAYMACGLWMVTGLYVDGWAHQAEKPETFFTPWHAVLYSGFAAAVLYSLLAAVRDRRAGTGAVLEEDRIAGLGLKLFAAGAVGDFLWHEIAGIEADLEALVSPTHLMLMIGGLLMVTLPVRAARRDGPGIEPAARVAVAASVGLAAAVLLFFLMYLSPWVEAWSFRLHYLPHDDRSTAAVQVGMASLLVAVVVLGGAVLWTARRWRLPFGAATVIAGGVALGQAGVEGFDVVLPVLAGVAAGAVADVLLRAEVDFPWVGAAMGAVLSGSFFALLHVESAVGWGPSLWVGAIVFSALAGYAVGLLTGGADRARGASPAPAVSSQVSGEKG